MITKRKIDMSHPCKNDPRGPYQPDYTESMSSDTLLKIRNDLMKMPTRHYPNTWEQRRLRRINQVLKSRNIKIN